jgi:spermidine synthase
MSSEVDQEFYHEHLVAPALYRVPTDKVLLLGAGPRGALTQILKLNPTHVTAVDIDPVATTIYQKYLPEWFSDDDPRIEYIFEDAILFLKKCESKFDAIICDFTFGADTFTDDLLLMLKERMTPTGILVSHYGAASFLDGTTPMVEQSFKKHFPFVKTWNAFVPSFGDLWGWVAASVVNPNEVAHSAWWVRLEKMKWVTPRNVWQLQNQTSYDVE